MSRRTPVRRVAYAIALTSAGLCLPAIPRDAHASGGPAWATDLTSSGLNQPRAAVMYDDGSGPALYVADLGRVYTRSASGWKQIGHDFRPNATGGGLAEISSLAVFNGELYAAGTFRRVGPGTSGGTIASNIVRLNATTGTWVGFGPGTTTAPTPTRGLAGNVGSITPRVHAMQVLDEDGPGPMAPALYVAGAFNTAGGASIRGVARWNGSAWSAMDNGHTDIAYALGQWDHDNDSLTANRLVIGGRFGGIGTSDTVNTQRIAMWTGTTWAPLASGLTGIDGVVDSLAAFDPDGAGPTPPYLAAGSLSFATFPELSVFDGIAWSGFIPTIGSAGDKQPFALGVIPGPSGDTLVAAINDPDAAGTSSNRFVAGWNQASGWSFVDGFLQGNICAQTTGSLALPRALPYLDLDGAGPGTSQLLVVGSLRKAGSAVSSGVAVLDNNSQLWEPVIGGNGSITAFSGPVVEFDDDASGPNPASVFVYSPNGMGTSLGSSVHRWTGSGWEPYGDCSGTNPSIRLTTASESGQPRLFVGGSLSSLEPSPLRALRSGTWEDVVGPSAEASFLVGDIVGHDASNAGPTATPLFVVQYYTNGLGNEAARVLRYDSGAWTTIPGEFTYTEGGTPGGVFLALTSVDTAGGPELIVSGRFNSIDSTAANFIARFNGASWEPMGSGLPAQTNRCRPAAVTLNGQEHIYIGGTYGANPGDAGVLRFNGTSWDLIPGAGTGGFNDWAALIEFDDETGPALYAVGPATGIDNVPLSSPRIAKYDGTQWSSVVGAGFSSVGSAVSMIVAEADGTRSLWVTGVSGNGPISSGIARLDVTVTTPCPGDYNDDGMVDLADLISFNTDWQPNIGQSVPVGTMGDYNDDGVVDLADLIGFNTDWQPNIGVPCP